MAIGRKKTENHHNNENNQFEGPVLLRPGYLTSFESLWCHFLHLYSGSDTPLRGLSKMLYVKYYGSCGCLIKPKLACLSSLLLY